MYAFLLLDLADYIEVIGQQHPKSFSMNKWATGPLNECNTAGCAVGWASVLFAHLGLSLGRWGYDGTLAPSYGKHRGWLAVQEFFGVLDGEDSYLFCGSEYEAYDITTPKQVADRIRYFVTSGGKMELYN
jgi:hypothetical protein